MVAPHGPPFVLAEEMEYREVRHQKWPDNVIHENTDDFCNGKDQEVGKQKGWTQLRLGRLRLPGHNTLLFTGTPG